MSGWSQERRSQKLRSEVDSITTMSGWSQERRSQKLRSEVDSITTMSGWSQERRSQKLRSEVDSITTISHGSTCEITVGSLGHGARQLHFICRRSYKRLASDLKFERSDVWFSFTYRTVSPRSVQPAVLRS